MPFRHKAAKFGFLSEREKLLLTNICGIKKKSSALECGCLWFLKAPQKGGRGREFVSANWGKANPHNGCIGLVAAHTQQGVMQLQNLCEFSQELR